LDHSLKKGTCALHTQHLSQHGDTAQRPAM